MLTACSPPLDIARAAFAECMAEAGLEVRNVTVSEAPLDATIDFGWELVDQGPLPANPELASAACTVRSAALVQREPGRPGTTPPSPVP